MCIWHSYVCKKCVLCFLIHKSHVRSIKGYYIIIISSIISVNSSSSNSSSSSSSIAAAIEFSLGGSSSYISTDKN